MTERNYEFAVFWVSPRGFANEGDWIYGPIAEIREYVGQTDPKNFHKETQHKTIEAARRSAINLARRDRRNTPSHEICAIGAASITGGLEDHDMNVVRYGWEADLD